MNKNQLTNIIKNSIKKILKENLAYNYNNDIEPETNNDTLVEMARINTRDNGKLFPTNSWEIKIWSNDHEPPHFHILKDGWNVSFLISNGQLYDIKTRGENEEILRYMCRNIEKWLNSKCAIIPKITNRENAEAQWLQIH